jgi:hypothetical protein
METYIDLKMMEICIIMSAMDKVIS